MLFQPYTYNLNFRPISDIDLPELPDFLRPDPSTPRPIRPIQDIDLPDGASVIQPDEEAEIIENKPFKEEEGKEIYEKNFFSYIPIIISLSSWVF